MSNRHGLDICLVAYPFGANGGIQTVTRLVVHALTANPAVNLRVIVVGGSRARRAWQYLGLWLFVLRGYRPMFMHAYLFEACPFRRSLRRLSNPIVWAHGIEVWGDYARKHLPSLDSLPELWAVSQFTAHQVAVNWPTALTRVVSLGVFPQASSRGCRHKSYAEKIRFLSVSRLDSQERYKGHHISLQALSRLKVAGVAFQMDFVGDGDDRLFLQALAADLDLESEVTFHGRLDQDKLHNLYGDADLFLMPSQVVQSESKMWGGEGFGLVYVEAAMYGVPSVAGEHGGQSDFIDHGLTGWRVAPGVDALVALLNHLVQHRHEITSCGTRCLERAQAYYSYDAFLHRIDDALTSPLSLQEKC